MGGDVAEGDTYHTQFEVRWDLQVIIFPLDIQNSTVLKNPKMQSFINDPGKAARWAS